jgi:capsular polysaccharide biosynthesis protein
VAPQSQQELDQLLRNRDMAQKNYDQLSQKLTASEMSTELESRKQGEMLEVVDLPSLPENPAAPNRPVIIAAGAFVGLGVGVVLIAFKELRDTSLKTLKDVRAYTQFNVVGSIPLLENDLIVKRRRRITVLAWSTAVVLSGIIVSGSIYYYMGTRV